MLKFNEQISQRHVRFIPWTEEVFIHQRLRRRVLSIEEHSSDFIKNMNRVVVLQIARLA